MEEREEFLTARQLAKVLQVSESTVRDWPASAAFPRFASHPRSFVSISMRFVNRWTFLSIAFVMASTLRQWTTANFPLKICC